MSAYLTTLTFAQASSHPFPGNPALLCGGFLQWIDLVWFENYSSIESQDKAGKAIVCLFMPQLLGFDLLQNTQPRNEVTEEDLYDMEETKRELL